MGVAGGVVRVDLELEKGLDAGGERSRMMCAWTSACVVVMGPNCSAVIPDHLQSGSFALTNKANICTLLDSQE